MGNRCAHNLQADRGGFGGSNIQVSMQTLPHTYTYLYTRAHSHSHTRARTHTCIHIRKHLRARALQKKYERALACVHTCSLPQTSSGASLSCILFCSHCTCTCSIPLYLSHLSRSVLSQEITIEEWNRPKHAERSLYFTIFSKMIWFYVIRNGNGLDTSPRRKIIDGLLEVQSGRYRVQDLSEDHVGEMTLWGNRERYGQG